MLVPFLPQELSTGSRPSNTEGYLGKGNPLRKREKNGRGRYRNIGHRVGEILTSNFNTMSFSDIVHRPLLKLSGDSYPSSGTPALAEGSTNAD